MKHGFYHKETTTHSRGKYISRDGVLIIGSAMLFKDRDVDAALALLLCECVDIDPPPSFAEIVEIFKDRMSLDAPEMIEASLRRLLLRGRIVSERRGYRVVQALL